MVTCKTDDKNNSYCAVYTTIYLKGLLVDIINRFLELILSVIKF